MAKQFGQTASDYEETRGSDDDVWIRTFKEASTRLRIIPMVGENRRGVEVTGTAAWPTEREHYAEMPIGSFPCDESKSCPGCTDVIEKVQRRDRKYYFHALDEKGAIRVFKMGPKLYRVFQNREQRLGTLSDRDYIVNKMGSGLDTTYDVEAGEKYEVPFDGLELPDIPEILAKRYSDAVAYYAGETPAGAPDVETGTEAKAEEPKAESSGRITPGGSTERITPGGSTEEPKGDEAKAPKPEAEVKEKAETPPAQVPEWGENPTADDLSGAETGEIKAWLESRKVEFPARAPRIRLLKIAREAAGLPPF